jgi:3-oxoacyl-[acyl-carrier protein] reductase
LGQRRTSRQHRDFNTSCQRKRIAGRSALRRLPDVDDVSLAWLEYLLGDGGRNITGSVLTVDAGSTA